MKMTAQEYARRVQKAGPHSPLLADCLWAFCVGGGICLLGEGLRQLFLRQGADAEAAGTLTSCTLILLSAVLTTLGWYQKLAAKAGAGSLVPITGFANAVVSAAIEFKAEGRVPGTGAKMFLIAGPVIVYGTLAAVVYGVVLWLLGASALYYGTAPPDIAASQHQYSTFRGIFCRKGEIFYDRAPGRYPVVPHPAGHRRTGGGGRQKRERRPAGSGL